MSNYDVLFAKSIPALWARTHQPVLSMRGHNPDRYTKYIKQVSKKKGADVPIERPGPNDHILITKFDLAEPAGCLVHCPVLCAWPVRAAKSATQVKVTCNKCGAACMIPQIKTNQATTLGRVSLVAVPYPQPVMYANWGPPPSANIVEGLGAEGPTIGDPATQATTIQNTITHVQDAVAVVDPAVSEVEDTVTETPSVKGTTEMAMRRSTRMRKPTPKAAEQEPASISAPLQPGRVSKGKRKATSVQASPPPLETRSRSTPTIRIPPRPRRVELVRKVSSPALSTSGSSGGSRSRSVTATPPPPSPLERPNTHERPPSPHSTVGIRKRLRVD